MYIKFLAEAVILTMFIELLSRGTLSGLMKFMESSQITFLCNVFIIFLTLMLSTLAGPWQSFMHGIIVMVWIILAVVNAIVLKYRMTPFSAEDFSMIPSLLRIAKNYLTKATIAALAAGIILLVAAIVFMWKTMPRRRMKKSWFMLAGRCVIAAVGCYAFLGMGMQTQAISTDFMNLADAYDEYGFAYCFSTSIVDVGIDKPSDYGPELYEEIADGMEMDAEQSLLHVNTSGTDEESFNNQTENVSVTDTNTAEGAETSSAVLVSEKKTYASVVVEDTVRTCCADEDVFTPNIIMIQLESFFDPSYLKNYTFSENPIPYFTALKEQYTSGFLTVPVVGAGTSNTEFEILTGMSTDYFGAGEYPYNTVLKSTAVEAIPQILRQYGYTSTAIHNNTGTFYNRNLVFANMGFDRFIPIEYMYDLETTPNNWAKDAALTQIMLDALEESEGPDFLYTITVQSHGRYPSEKVLDDPQITVTNKEDPDEQNNALEYYVNMIHEVDEMVEDLCTQLSETDEPTVVVMYGDHLPALGFDEDGLSQPSLYMTEYVIWNNFGMEIADTDMQAESIGTAVMQLFDLDNGILPKFHEIYDGAEQYGEYLEAIEYDMLYGNGYAFTELLQGDTLDEQLMESETEEEGEPVRLYQASDLKIGYKPITLTGYTYSSENHSITVYGQNFNKYSKIVIDDKEKETVYIDSNTLLLGSAPSSLSSLYVGQFDENGKQLGEGTNVITQISS